MSTLRGQDAILAACHAKADLDKCLEQESPSNGECGWVLCVFMKGWGAGKTETSPGAEIVTQKKILRKKSVSGNIIPERAGWFELSRVWLSYSRSCRLQGSGGKLKRGLFLRELQDNLLSYPKDVDDEGNA